MNEQSAPTPPADGHDEIVDDRSTSTAAEILSHVKDDPWGALATLGLAVSVIFAVVELRYLTSLNNGGTTLLRNLGYGAWTLGLLMLVTFGVRTLRIRHVLRLWLLGFFPVLASVLIAGRLTEFIADNGNLRTAFLIPIIEEFFKLVPLLLIVAIAWVRKTIEPSITDFAIGGFAIGAGFGLHEDGLWVRDIAGGFDGSWWGRLFPNFLNDDPFVVAHPGWTALVGLGIGLAWHFRKARFAWAIGALPLAVATLDHISINYRGDAASRLRSLVLEGRLSAWMLIVGFVVAVLIDLDTRRKGVTGLPSRTARDCVSEPRTVPGKARLPLAMILIAQLRHLNGVAYRRARTLDLTSAPAADDPTPTTTSPTTF